MVDAPGVHKLIAAGRLVLTVEEAASALGIARSSAYAATRTGDLPSRRIGRRVIVPIAQLLTWLGGEVVNGAHPAGPDGAGNEESAPRT